MLAFGRGDQVCAYADPSLIEVVLDQAPADQHTRLRQTMRAMGTYLDSHVPPKVRENHSCLITIVPSYIDNWINSIKLDGNGPSNGYRRYRYYWATQVIKHLSTAMGTDVNPMLCVLKPTGPHLPHLPLTDTQLVRLYTSVFKTSHRTHHHVTTQRDRALLALLGDHGLRPAHITRANLAQLHRNTGANGRHNLALSSVKRGPAHLLELSDRATHAVSSYLRLRGQARKTAPLIATTGGERMTTQTVRQIVRRAARRAGIHDCTPYTLRRTFAHRLWRRTGDLEIVRRALFHSTLAATAYYLGQITPVTSGADFAHTDDPLQPWD